MTQYEKLVLRLLAIILMRISNGCSNVRELDEDDALVKAVQRATEE